MKILQLDIEGFRSLKKVSWKPGDLNVVIGPNGTGKSNLLRFLELMAISAQGHLGKYIQSLGGMEPLVWDGQASSIASQVKTELIEKEPDPQQFTLTYELELARLGRGSTYRIQRELLASCLIKNSKPVGPTKLLERNGSDIQIISGLTIALDTSLTEYVSEEETCVSIMGPFVTSPLIGRFKGRLAAWAVYHDVQVHRDATLRQAAVARPEKRIEPDGQNLIPVLHTLYTGDRDFKKDINEAMRAAFGDDFEELIFPPAADQRIQLRVRWKSLKREQSAADLSDGTLRFLFLLTVLASPSPPPVIAIDEPETGLHPSMLPIIAEHAVDASTRSQIIFTTHSPQFLDAFTDTKPTTTVAKWSNGETILKTLGGAEIDYWLKEYSLGALFRSGELESME
jgi:predicted ATPase